MSKKNFSITSVYITEEAYLHDGDEWLDIFLAVNNKIRREIFFP